MIYYSIQMICGNLLRVARKMHGPPHRLLQRTRGNQAAAVQKMHGRPPPIGQAAAAAAAAKAAAKAVVKIGVAVRRPVQRIAGNHELQRKLGPHHQVVQRVVGNRVAPQKHPSLGIGNGRHILRRNHPPLHRKYH